jgi:hypothetical protein
MTEDEYSGEKSVTSDQPTAADYEPEVNYFRSLAAIAVVYGTSGVMLVPFGIYRLHEGAIAGELMVRIFDEPLTSLSFHGLWLFGSSVLGGLLGLALMVGAIGGVQLKSWSLPVLRIWAVVSLILGIFGSAVWLQWLYAPWRASLADVRGVDDALFNLGGWMIGTALALGMTIMINRPRVKEALRRGGRIADVDASKSHA